MADTSKVPMGSRHLEIEVSNERIVDLFISACEGGSNYWCIKLTPKGRVTKTIDAYEAMLAGFTCKVDTEDRDETKRIQKYTVTKKDIDEALYLFATKWPRHFGDWLSENDDAETGDVFLQLCVLKDVIYG